MIFITNLLKKLWVHVRTASPVQFDVLNEVIFLAWKGRIDNNILQNNKVIDVKSEIKQIDVVFSVLSNGIESIKSWIPFVRYFVRFRKVTLLYFI